jgi:hypothetical protein
MAAKKKGRRKMTDEEKAAAKLKREEKKAEAKPESEENLLTLLDSDGGENLPAVDAPPELPKAEGPPPPEPPEPEPEDNPEDRGWMTLKEVCGLFGVSRPFVSGFVARGRIPGLESSVQGVKMRWYPVQVEVLRRALDIIDTLDHMRKQEEHIFACATVTPDRTEGRLLLQTDRGMRLSDGIGTMRMMSLKPILYIPRPHK